MMMMMMSYYAKFAILIIDFMNELLLRTCQHSCDRVGHQHKMMMSFTDLKSRLLLFIMTIFRGY